MNHHVHILLLGKILKNSQKLVLKKCEFFRRIRNTNRGEVRLEMQYLPKEISWEV